jgi:5-methylcytosine-specific restriction endonuclease McrA
MCVNCVNTAYSVNQRKYKTSSKGRATQRLYNQLPSTKERKLKSIKTHMASEHGRAVRNIANQNHYAKYHNIEGFHTADQWIQLKEQCGFQCLRCGAKEIDLDSPLEQDHIVPISKNGTNWISNIQPLCKACNGMGGKGTKIIDYRKSLPCFSQ